MFHQGGVLGHRDPSPLPHRRVGAEGGSCSGVTGLRLQKGKGHTERSSIDLLICVVFVFLVSFLIFKLERGDFLSEEWRERIANTRYSTAIE